MRFEGDTWDIVSSVGRTALGVATFRAIENERSDRIMRDDYARMFVEAAGDRHFIEVLADPDSLGARNFMPLMMGPRTKFFDDFFESATRAGAKQAVILAAGLDARAYRLDWPAGTTVYEIDQPAVLEFKDKVLSENAAKPTAQRRTVAVDLRDDWPAALQANGFDPTMPSSWSAEGLLSFLPGAAQDALFERIDALSVPGSQIAAHAMPSGTDFAKLREAAEKFFDRNPFGDQEPTDLWYDDAHADPVQWLGERGWTVQARSTMDLVTSYGRSLPDMGDIPPELLQMGQRLSFWTAVKS